MSRNKFYSENNERNKQKSTFENYNDFLVSLNMKAEIKPFSDIYIDRITQLINKTNQFNLTTKRYKLNEIEEISLSEKFITLYGKLNDKFGDNGIVSLIICEIQKKTVKIDSWIMSCRVFSRDLEITIFNKLVSNIKKIDAKYLIGEYYKTEKNIIVKNLYKELGFKCVKKRKDYSKWSLNLEEYKLKENNNIKIF